MELNHGDIEMPDDEPAADQQTLGDALNRVEELEATLLATRQEAITQSEALQTELSTVRQELAQSTAVSNDLQNRVTALGSQVTEAIGASTAAGGDSNAVIATLRAENATLRRENAAYAANRVTMEAQIQVLEAAGLNEGGQDLAAMTADRDQMERERDAFHYQIKGGDGVDGFEKTIERLRAQIAQAEPQALQERNALLEGQIETIEADLAALPTQAQWATAQEQLQEYEDLKLEHTDSQLLVASLERQLKDSKLDLAKAHLALAQNSGGQVQTEQSSQSQIPEAQNAELLMQVRTLEVRIAEQDVEITNLRTAQEEMEREAIRRQLELDEVRQAGVVVVERADGLARIIERRDRRIAYMERGIMELAERATEMGEGFIAEEERLERRVAALQRDVTASQTRLDELADADNALLQVNQENEELRDQLDSGAVENGVQDELNDALEYNITLEQKIEKLEAIIAELNANTPNAPQPHPLAELAADIEALQIPFDQLNARAAELSAENATLQDLLSAAQQGNNQSNETANHEKQIRQLRDRCAQEKEDLRAEIERLQNALEKLSTDATNESAALNARFAEALAQVTELETHKTDCTHQNEPLEQQLLAARGSLQVSENALEKALSDLASCEENNESAQAHKGLLQCQAEIERLETALANANGELKNVKAAQATLTKELEDVQAQLQLAKENIDQLQNIIQSQKSQFDVAYGQSQERYQALQQAQADLFDCRQAHADNQGVLKIWGDRLHEYEEADKERAETQNPEAAPVDDEALKKLRQEAAQKEAAHGQALLEIGVELAAGRQQHTEDQNTIQDFQNRLEKMKRADNKIIDSMEEDLNKAQQDLAACREQQEEGSPNNELQEALKKAQEELAACRVHSAEKQSTIQDLENQLAQLEHQLESHEPPTDDHEQALNEAQEGLAACREQRAEDKNTIQDLENENDEHQNALSITREELATCRQRVADHEKTIRDLQSQILQIEESAHERQAVYEQVLNEAQGELAACREQHDDDQKDLQDWRNNCASLRKGIKDLTASHKEAVAKGNARMKQDSEDIANLQRRLVTALAAIKANGTAGSNDAIKALSDRITELERELQACHALRTEMQSVMNDLREQFTEDKRTILTLTNQVLEGAERERRLEDELEVVRQNLLNTEAFHDALQLAATANTGADFQHVVTGFDAQIVSLRNQVATSEYFRLDLTNQLNEPRSNPNATEQQQAARITGLENHIEALADQIMELENGILAHEQVITRAETVIKQLRAQLPPEPAATGTDGEARPKPSPPHPRLILRSGRTYRRVPQPAPTRRNTTAPRPLYTGLASGGIRKRPSTKKEKKDKK
jgi:chromosome segregation ATPase